MLVHGSGDSIWNEVLIYGMGCLYMGLGISTRNGVLVYGMGC